MTDGWQESRQRRMMSWLATGLRSKRNQASGSGEPGEPHPRQKLNTDRQRGRDKKKLETWGSGKHKKYGELMRHGLSVCHFWVESQCTAHATSKGLHEGEYIQDQQVWLLNTLSQWHHWFHSSETAVLKLSPEHDNEPSKQKASAHLRKCLSGLEHHDSTHIITNLHTMTDGEW